MTIKSPPYTKLSLKVDFKALNNPKFLDTLQKFNNTLIAGVELIFRDEEVNQFSSEILTALTSTVAPKISYPLQIRQSEAAEKIVATKLELQTFQSIVIANIQKRNKEGRKPLAQDATRKEVKESVDLRDPLNKKIILKDLVRRKKLSSEDLPHYIPLEVQLVETVEQEIAVQHQELVEVEAQVELAEIQEYDGELVLGFDEFSAPLYKNKVEEVTGDKELTQFLYERLRHELFANLPHAIKFISPAAAEPLALNLQGLVTLNKDNLPNGFILKRTKLGELILDFDPYLENKQPDPFTPVGFDIDPKPIYDIELNEEAVKNWIGDEQWVPYIKSKQLINLWINYGDEGCTAFFNDVRAATQSNPEFAAFLFSSYLAHLPQWDLLFNNRAFFNSIERISHYDEQKLSCLKKFLQDTGNSRHDLTKTIEAFEVFWNELKLLCSKHKVYIEKINQGNWSTLKGGNPVVFMERLLFILKNARSFEDQLNLLKGRLSDDYADLFEGDITLDNYGPYYASRYEGFKAVSAAMALKYDVTQQNQRPFSRNFNLYRVELDSLVEAYLQEQRDQKFINKLLSVSNYDYKEDNPFYLVNCEKELPKPFTFERLKKEGLIFPFDADKFAPPLSMLLLQSRWKHEVTAR